MEIPADNTTARVIRKALRPVRPLANQIFRRLVVPALLSLGRRRPAMAPVEASYLGYSFGYDEEDEIRAAIARAQNLGKA